MTGRRHIKPVVQESSLVSRLLLAGGFAPGPLADCQSATPAQSCVSLADCWSVQQRQAGALASRWTRQTRPSRPPTHGARRWRPLFRPAWCSSADWRAMGPGLRADPVAAAYPQPWLVCGCRVTQTRAFDTEAASSSYATGWYSSGCMSAVLRHPHAQPHGRPANRRRQPCCCAAPMQASLWMGSAASSAPTAMSSRQVLFVAAAASRTPR